MRGIDRLRFGRAVIAQPDREDHQHGGGEELGLPVLHRLEPESGAPEMLPQGRGDRAMPERNLSRLARAFEEVRDEAESEEKPEGQSERVGIEPRPGTTEVRTRPQDQRRESVRIHDALRGLGYPFDVIVISSQWFEDSKEVIGGIAYPANKYGKVIYAAA